MLALIGLQGSMASTAAFSFHEDFEAGLDRWRLDSAEQFEILTEPGTSNHLLQLTPKPRGFAHAILEESRDWRDLRVEGRFQFPTEGWRTIEPEPRTHPPGRLSARPTGWMSGSMGSTVALSLRSGSSGPTSSRRASILVRAFQSSHGRDETS